MVWCVEPQQTSDWHEAAEGTPECTYHRALCQRGISSNELHCQRNETEPPHTQAFITHTLTESLLHAHTLTFADAD